MDDLDKNFKDDIDNKVIINVKINDNLILNKILFMDDWKVEIIFKENHIEVINIVIVIIVCKGDWERKVPDKKVVNNVEVVLNCKDMIFDVVEIKEVIVVKEDNFLVVDFKDDLVVFLNSNLINYYFKKVTISAD